jgi:hypothetical protein
MDTIQISAENIIVSPPPVAELIYRRCFFFFLLEEEVSSAAGHMSRVAVIHNSGSGPVSIDFAEIAAACM